ncbi:glycosyltransferase family 4 protein [Acetobacter indonesiensis]|uniref:glycosyltransferase family 4 protein n=1 Tax=Acetobacter indonesiensis TaxID=104101 RepID=UPI0039EB8440
MRTITFLNPFKRSLWTGGIKTTLYHAELLHQNGFPVRIFQPDGIPDAAPDSTKPLFISELNIPNNDITIFPECLNDFLRDWIEMPEIQNKYIFCQNQYYFYAYNISTKDLERFGVKGLLCPSEFSKKSLVNVLGINPDFIHVVPCVVDREMFKSHMIKRNQIVTASRKWRGMEGIPSYSFLLRSMLHLKYPELSDIPWIMLEHQPQQLVAEAMNASTVFLSLSRLESLGLTPLEAMSARCLVVGYHGAGGLEYATPQNGFWFSPEQQEEVVDALALALNGLPAQNPVLTKMLDAGEYTASQFNVQAATTALIETYRAFCHH